MKKRILSITLVGALAATAFVSLSGCGKDSASNQGDTGGKEPITFTYFDQNVPNSIYPNSPDYFGGDMVSQEITKRTGVTLDVIPNSGNPQEKLSLMLASNDYPDIIAIDRSLGMIEKFVAANAIIPLDDLIKTHAPDLTREYEKAGVSKKIRYQDGKVYGLPNWYGLPQESVLGFQFRRDLLKEVVDEETFNGNDYISQDELVDILKAIKEKHPTLNGKETIPMVLWAENWGGVIGAFKGMFGLKSYYEKDGRLYYDFRDPQYVEMLRYMNMLYREGLIDKEWATTKQQMWEQKLTGGYAASTTDAYWNLKNVNNSLSSKDPEQIFYSYKVVADGVDPSQTTYSGRNSLGWDVISISKTNPDPERAMEFLNYLGSEEGQILLMSGIEGVNYNIVDGKREAIPETIELFESDSGEYVSKYGVRYWTMCVNNGLASDGQPYYLYKTCLQDPVQKFADRVLGDSVWDVAPFEGLGPKSNTQEALISQKLNEKSGEYCTKAINAATEEEFNAIIAEYQAEMDRLGAEKIEEIINQNYQEKLNLWR
ncbi:MAG: extracellular solute-binding protein [Monoglobaceae bacterium]